MKKYILSWIIAVAACFAFADVKNELKNIVKKNINSKEFEQADKRIHFLQDKGDKLSSQGKYDEAIKSFQNALEQADKLYGKNSTAAAACYTGIGMTYAKKGGKNKAADNLVKAAEIFKNSLGKNVRPRASRFLLMHAGYLYYDSNCTRKACKVLEQAEQQDIPMFSPAEKEKRLPEFYRYLALSYFKENKYKKSIPCFQKSILIESKKTKPDNKELGVINLFLGNALLDTDKTKEALTHLQKTEKYFSLCKMDTYYKYKLFFSLSTAYKHLGKNKKNLFYSQKLYEISESFKENDFRRIIGKVTLADAMYLVGKRSTAIKIMQKALYLAKKNKESPSAIKKMTNILKKMQNASSIEK